MKQLFRRHRYSVSLLLCTFGLYFLFIFSQMLSYRSDGLWAGHVHIWGDWSLHIAIANIFAYKQPSEWFAYHPYYAGGKFTYGFLTNMISGLLIRAGLSLPAAFLLPSMLYSILLILGLYTLFFLLMRSQKAAVTATSLFFLSSGPGFIRFAQAWLERPTLEHLFFPTKDYSRIEPVYQWLAGNFVNGMLVPQRAYLLGMTITVWVMCGVLSIVRHRSRKNTLTWQEKVALTLCGVGAGILPITHMHSFIVLIIVSALFGLTQVKSWRQLLWYAVPAGFVSTVLYTRFVHGGIENPEFMKILIGWTTRRGETPLGTCIFWLRMWWEIWGVALPTALVGLWIARKRLALSAQAVTLSSLVIFGLANVVLFQPIHWDNSKLFMWAYLFFCIPMTLVLQELWRKRGVFAACAVMLAVVLTATGVMELWRLTRFDKNSYIMADFDDIELGRLIRQHTHSQAIILAAPTHNHPAMIWGVRPMLLGYPAWALNFGFLYQQRERDITIMYQGGEVAETLLKQYKVSFISFGPNELYNLKANEQYFETQYPLFLKSRSHRLYDVRTLTGGL